MRDDLGERPDPRPAKRILMCPPDFFGIEYEINPWMNRCRPCDHDSAVRQWRNLCGVLKESGAKVLTVRPVAGLPDLVFTANAALIYRQLAILSTFRHVQRRPERHHFDRWLSDNGFHTYRLRSNAYFEGAGDALFCGETLFAGYRIRSDIRASQEIGALTDCRVIPLELVDRRFYHLDTCFCPLASDCAVYFPHAFDRYGQRVLRKEIDDLIPVCEAEARRFACNAVVVGKAVVTNTGCTELGRQLRKRGFCHRETSLDQFIKAGGAAKCLTLRLDGEDAAAWRTALPRRHWRYG